MPVSLPCLNRRAALACAAALLVATQAACAGEQRTRTPPVALSIVDRDSGQMLALYRKDGLTWVAGTPASRYAIRISNQTGGRVLVVLSVDGVNVISGQSAEVGQTGYVLDPWRSYDIAGWRKSDTQIAAFEFAALGDSYAARTGRPANVGVVGAAVFLEKPAPPPPLAAAPMADARAAAAPLDALGSAQAPRSERLGTAHGQREWSVSSRTQFERLGSGPQALLEIHYDSQPNLVAAGVIPGPVITQARAFPGEEARGYVPDPPRR